MSDSNWLANLKVGDEVVAHGSRYNPDSLAKVERLTATQIIAGGDRYRRKDGGWLGNGGYNFIYLQPVTQEKRDEINHQKAATILSKWDYKSLPLSTLRELLSIVRREQPKTQEDEK